MSPQQILNPVPPNGFNYEYLNAIDHDLDLKAAIDPATQLALNEARRYACGTIAAPGYILWDGGAYVSPQDSEAASDDSTSAPQQPQVIVVQVPAPAQSAAKLPAETQAQAPEEAPLPDVGQFILVRRDGVQLKAAAFTRSGDMIVYITPDGLRHSIAVSDLDTDATLRLNSERGSELQLSL